MNSLEIKEIEFLNQNSRIEISGPSNLKRVAEDLKKINLKSNKSKNIIIFTTAGTIQRNTLASFIKNLTLDFSLKCISVKSNPEIRFLNNLCFKLKKWKKIDFIIAIGGGSVIDSAKIISAVLCDENKSLTVNRALKIKIKKTFACIPVYAIPTTAGTGSEVTPFATIWDFEKERKYSLENLEKSVKKIYLIPELTVSCPRKITLNCALDTCSHAIETLWNRYRTDKSVEFALHALNIFNNSIDFLLNDLNNTELRFNMQIAAVWSGLAISINHTSLAHALSYELTMQYGLPHGYACSCTLTKIEKLLSLNKEWELLKKNEIVKKTFFILEKIDFEKILGKYGIKKIDIKKIDPQRAKNFILDVSSGKIDL